MPATPRQVVFTEDDFKERLSYDDLEDGDYEAFLEDVTDIEANTGNFGWGFKFTVKGLPSPADCGSRVAAVGRCERCSTPSASR